MLEAECDLDLLTEARLAASPSLASSPWRTPCVRSRSAPGPAPIRRAETLVVLADGRRPLAC
ncbi:MAG TPA: hypothetical protein PKJ51_09385, partial [Methanothrix sp.]|nr:hypothetical protein [Methanothrix sp.]